MQPERNSPEALTQPRMSDPTKPPSLDDLSKRLSKAREERGLDRNAGGDRDMAAGAGLGMAYRIAIEIVVAVVVCAGIGWAIDQWLNTTPWVMLVLLLLGFVAGLNNAVRTANRMDAQAAARARDADGGEPK